MINKKHLAIFAAFIFVGLIGFNAMQSTDTKDDTADTVAKSTTSQLPASDQQQLAMPTAGSTQAAAPATDHKEKQEIPAEYAHIEERLEVMQTRRPNQHFDPAAVAAAVSRDIAWETAEEAPSNLPLKPEELTDGRQFINFDSLKLETLMPGDDLKVTIDETGEDYLVTMDRVEKHDYDSISWYGHIDAADGQTYNVSFTRGKGLTVAGLDTPDGHYVLQSHGDNGWIASSGLLFKIDPNVPDVIYPEDVMKSEGEGQK